MSLRVGCAQVWGGIDNADRDLETGALSASLFSRSAEGGKGGDIYFLSVCEMDFLTRLAIADVMGHGREVSKLSGWVYDALRTNLNNPDGAEIAGQLNRRVEQRGFHAMTTIVLASIVVKDNHLYFTYAGHPPLMVWRRREKRWLPAQVPANSRPCNLPLGIEADACYDQSCLVFESGDKLFLYTDGVVEAPNSEGEQFGYERLVGVLNTHGRETPRKLKKSVLDAVLLHTGGTINHDDVTLMAVEAHHLQS